MKQNSAEDGGGGSQASRRRNLKEIVAPRQRRTAGLFKWNQGNLLDNSSWKTQVKSTLLAVLLRRCMLANAISGLARVFACTLACQPQWFYSRYIALDMKWHSLLPLCMLGV